MATLSPLFSWRSSVVSSELSPTTKHVALTLSLYMSERGDSAFPSVATLVNDTSLAERTVQGHLLKLVDGGWLTAKTRTGRSTIYASTVPAADAPPQQMHPRSSQPEPPQLTTETPAADAPYDDKDLFNECVATDKLAPLIESITEVCGINQAELTAKRFERLVAIAVELEQVGANAEEVSRRAAQYRSMFDVPLTAEALAKHWANLGTPKPGRAQPSPSCDRCTNGLIHDEASNSFAPCDHKAVA